MYTTPQSWIQYIKKPRWIDLDLIPATSSHHKELACLDSNFCTVFSNSFLSLLCLFLRYECWFPFFHLFAEFSDYQRRNNSIQWCQWVCKSIFFKEMIISPPPIEKIGCRVRNIRKKIDRQVYIYIWPTSEDWLLDVIVL